MESDDDGVGVVLVGVAVGDAVGVFGGLGVGVEVRVGVGVGVGDGVGVRVAVGAGNASKFAVMFPGPFMVAVVEPELEFSSVMPVSADHEENLKPEEGVPDIEIAPASCQVLGPEGLVVPAAEGLTANDTRYWVFQFQLMLEGALIVMVIADALPEFVTLPVPDQPEQTYCVPVLPETGEATKALMLDPLSYQPFAGEGESYAEVVVK